MVARICSQRPLRAASSPPHRLATKMFALDVPARIKMKTRMGITFATVTTVLMKAASLIPRRIVKWNSQSAIDETTTAGTVSPLPKTGKNAPSVDLISTQYDTLPMQLPIQ